MIAPTKVLDSCTPLGSDNQVVTTGGLIKHAINDAVDHQDRNHQGDTQGNAQSCQERSDAALSDTFPGNGQSIHRGDYFVRKRRFMNDSINLQLASGAGMHLIEFCQCFNAFKLLRDFLRVGDQQHGNLILTAGIAK